MNTKTLLAAMIIMLAVSACARRPQYISPVLQDLNAYTSLSCKELDMEQMRLTSDLSKLEASQNRKATADAWGVALAGLLYLGIRTLAGYEEHEAEIAIKKGNLQHIREAKTANDCNT